MASDTKVTHINELPEKAGWYWWSPIDMFAGLDFVTFPVHVKEYGDRARVRNPLNRRVEIPRLAPEGPCAVLGLLIQDTGRTVRTMGGIWLGEITSPAAPPGPEEKIIYAKSRSDVSASDLGLSGKEKP
jgi:hypothetical protein